MPRPQTTREAWLRFGAAWSDLWDELSGTTPGYYIRMLAERLATPKGRLILEDNARRTLGLSDANIPKTAKERMMPRPLPQHVRFLKDGTGRPCVAIEYEDYLGGYRYAVVVLSENDTPTKADAHRRLRSRMQASRQQKDGKLFVSFKRWNGRPDNVNMVMVLVKAAALLRIGWTADKAVFTAHINGLTNAVAHVGTEGIGNCMSMLLDTSGCQDLKAAASEAIGELLFDQVPPMRVAHPVKKVHPMGNATSVATGGSLAPEA